MCNKIIKQAIEIIEDNINGCSKLCKDIRVINLREHKKEKCYSYDIIISDEDGSERINDLDADFEVIENCISKYNLERKAA